MSLRISLRDGEKMIVNGAVLRAVGRTDLVIENQAALLRGREIMAPDEATTPARRLYCATMMAYIEHGDLAAHQDRIVTLLGDLMHLADALKTHDEPDDPLGARWPQDPDGTRHGLMATHLAAENYHFDVIGDGDYPVDDRGYQLATTAGDLVQLASRFREH